MNKIRLATVFSGIGAVEWALKRMGIDHEIVFACDNGEVDIDYDLETERMALDKLHDINLKKMYVDDLYSRKTRKTNFVKKSYLGNYPHCPENRFFQDILLLDGKDFQGSIDLLVGGSPCQSFSSVGRGEGLNDPRGNLLFEFTRLVEETQPKVFIYENVRNILNHNDGKTWESIKQKFESLNYHITEPQILNSMNYGIPQNRKRLFVIGSKKDFQIEWPPKEKLLQYNLKDFLLDNCSEGNFMHNKEGDLIVSKKKGDIDEKYILTPKLYAYVMKSGTKSFYQKPVINLNIARPLLKTMGNRHRAGIDNYVSLDNKSKDLGQVRMLTEREALRLMGFTDDFNIVVSRAQVYKQAGNSIVVDVLMSIIQSLITAKMFDEYE